MDWDYHNIQVGAMQGWQCPICKRVLSPWTMMCPCNGEGVNTTVSTTSTDSKITVSTSSPRTCGECPHTDGKVYTSIPPKYRCSKTGRYHYGNDACDNYNITTANNE